MTARIYNLSYEKIMRSNYSDELKFSLVLMEAIQTIGD